MTEQANGAASPHEVEPTLPLPTYDTGWTPPANPDFERPYELYRATADYPAPQGPPAYAPPPTPTYGDPTTYTDPAQPPVWWPAAPVRRPPSHVTGAFLATVFLCFPLGGVALYNALRVDPLFDRGDHEGARRASDRAGAWLVWAVAMGLAFLALVVMFFLTRR